PFILKVRHVEHAAQPVTAPGCDVVDLIDRRSDHVSFAGEGKRVVRSLPLIKANAPDLHTRLECVASVRPTKVVDHSESTSDLDVGGVVIERYEIAARVDRKRQRAGLRIVEG